MRDAIFEEFRRHRALLWWLKNTRPDVAFMANKSAQVSLQIFTTRKVKKLDATIKKVKVKTSLAFLNVPLDLDRIHLRIYTDALVTSNGRLSS